MANRAERRRQKKFGSPKLSGRSCAGCTVCCKLLSIEELKKPQQKWCEHCETGVGCQIYKTKPTSCSEFYCGWLANEGIDDRWKPADCGMVLHYEHWANRIVVHVDADAKDAWRAEPYFSQIKDWAIRASFDMGQVIVWEGADAIAITPDDEINLGPVRQDQLIVTRERQTFLGRKVEVLVMEREDPRIEGLQTPTPKNPRTTEG